MTYRGQKTYVLLLAVFSIISVVILGVLINGQVSTLNQSWHSYSEKEVSKNSALSEVVLGFGYGGFIHQFKNLILRQDETYSIAAQLSLDDTYRGIEKYLSIETNEALRHQANQLQKTIDTYQENLIITQDLIQEGRSAAEIDAIVQTDDTIALYALNTLLTSINQSSIAAKGQAEGNIGSLQSITIFGFSVILLTLLFSLYLIHKKNLSVIESLKETNVLFSSVPNAIIVANSSGRIINANRKASELFEYSMEELKMLTIDNFVPRSTDKEKDTQRTQSDRTRSSSENRLEFSVVSKSGKKIPVDITVSSYDSNHGKKSIAVVRDMSIEKQLEAESVNDHLTNIPNRKKCFEFLNDCINQARRYNSPLSVIMCDIDGFKKVNDTYGHNRGDEVIVSVSQLLTGNIRNTDLLARWGGEEFMIICPRTTKKMAFLLAEKLRTIVEFTYEHEKIPITISLGVTEFNIADDEKLELLGRVDEALYESKNKGKNLTHIH